MRIAVTEFGPLVLIELRVLIAAVFLFPIVVIRGKLRELRAAARPIFVMGVINSALPFSLIAFAALSLSAGFAAILNATSVFFAALIAYAWLGERLTAMSISGLVMGFSGVVVLVWDKASLSAKGAALAVFAALAAAFLYGLAANYSRQRLSEVDALTASAGSQISAAVFLAPAAALALPSASPSAHAWVAVIALGVLSTGVAYVLYFRLLARIGATRAILVTFLIPAFGMLWGVLVLDETVTLHMIAGTIVILAGTTMTVGVAAIRKPRRNAS